MRVLVDDGAHPAPTRAAMVEALEWLATDARNGDSLFLHFSGHGGRIRDDDGDEEDGYDETLYPSDFKTAGQLRDDFIYRKLVLKLPKGCQLLSIMDCCHSGTVLDLPFEFAASEVNCMKKLEKQKSVFMNKKESHDVSRCRMQSLQQACAMAGLAVLAMTVKSVVSRK
eukprot:CAMPEP_0114261146 /NCGR_PEP_ID=MMETSP0058-20121206/20943_1 /TAXON_ID=36894 /ORGANISM="Pyramimonas parkeae, CCMP726" /LENGTH=168 /DNA_ID=CAMNT_0001376585 /DNA_START=44 /DNA_END=550 /DNA_ORIENTATION=-